DSRWWLGTPRDLHQVRCGGEGHRPGDLLGAEPPVILPEQGQVVGALEQLTQPTADQRGVPVAAAKLLPARVDKRNHSVLSSRGRRHFSSSTRSNSPNPVSWASCSRVGSTRSPSQKPRATATCSRRKRSLSLAHCSSTASTLTTPCPGACLSR